MARSIVLQPALLAAVMVARLLEAPSADAQSNAPGSGFMPFLDEPMAMELGDVTLTLTGSLEARMTSGSDVENANGADLISGLRVSAETQLPNRLRVEASYSGQYVTNLSLSPDPDRKYTDDLALSAGGIWGTLLVGNVSDTVREQTRRQRGFGAADLAFDNFHGELTDRSAGYVGRFGPWVASSLVDDDSSIELGAMYQRPYGNKDYRLALRAGQGSLVTEDESTRYSTLGSSLVGEVIYGSTSFDIGLGHERFSSPGLEDATRWYVSTGVRRKITVFGLSVEGHYGEIEGQREVSAALGLQYDLARGASANFGLNQEEAMVAVADELFLESSDTTAIVSFVYSF